MSSMLKRYRLRELAAEHAVALPLVVFGLIRRDWLLTSSSWNDAWVQFDTFRESGNLTPWAFESYKSTRVLLLLLGQTLFALIGAYWGQIALAVVSILFLYLSLRFLSRSLLGFVHPLVVGLGLFYPGFHGSGSWMYQNILGIPLLIVVLGLSLRIANNPIRNSDKVDPAWFAQAAILVSLLYSQYSFFFPVVAWSLCALLALERQGSLRFRYLRQVSLSCTVGVISALLLHEIVSLLVGRKPPAIGSLFDFAFTGLQSGAFENFKIPIREWIWSASFLAPIALFALSLATINLRPLQSDGESITPTISKRVMVFGLVGVGSSVIVHVAGVVVLNFSWYGVGLVAPLLPLGAAVVVQPWKAQSLESRQSRYRLLDSILLGVGCCFGWQVSSVNIFQTSLFAAASLWVGVAALLLLGARSRRGLRLVLVTAAFVLLGVGTSSSAYKVGACEQREVDFALIDKMVDFGTAVGLQETTYLFGVNEQTAKCQPQLGLVTQNAMGEHIYPFSTSDELSETIRAHPLSSSLVLAQTPDSARRAITTAEEQLSRRLSIVDVTNEVGAAVTVVKVRHETESLLELRRQLTLTGGPDVENELKRVVSSETYQVAEPLYSSHDPSSLAVLVVGDHDVFHSLFPNASSLSRETLSTSAELSGQKICEALSTGRLKSIVVGPGLDVISKKQELHALKRRVRMCLNELGFRYVETPSNSESPATFQLS